MSAEQHPMRHLLLPTAHLVMQGLACMWSIIFSLAVGSHVALGITMFSRALVLAGQFVALVVLPYARDQNPFN